MAAMTFKSYFDDSGEETDPQHKASSLGGFVATVEDWKKFEDHWQQRVLDRFDLDYMHMIEFKGYEGKFAKFKDDRYLEMTLFQNMIMVIRDCHLTPIASTLRLSDLRKFNLAHGQKLNDYSFNVYACMLFTKVLYGENIVDMFLDRTNDVYRKADRAERYAALDPNYGDLNKTVQLKILGEGETFRNILPIQVSDFIAWELRRDAQGKDQWHESIAPDLTSTEYRKSLYQWCKANNKHYPFHRKSLGTLSRSALIRDLQWNYATLCGAHEARKGNWGTESKTMLRKRRVSAVQSS